VAVLAALSVGGCLYADTINGEPQARIGKSTPGPHYVGSEVTMTAFESTDPDHDVLSATWVAVQCEDAAGNSCPPDQSQIIGTKSDSVSTDFTFQVRDKTPVLVTLTVRDDRGATTQDWMYVEVQNRDPEVDLQRQPVGTEYTLGTSVRVVARGTDPDGDAPLYYAAQAKPPRGSLPDQTRFEKFSETSDEAIWELEPDVSGLWVVEVTVRDGTGADAGEVVKEIPVLFVDDAPPCVTATDPLAVSGASYVVDTAGGVRRFAVTSVSDDLDSYPAASGPYQGEAEFRWFIASPDTSGQFVAVSGNTANDYFVDPSAYAPGDVVKVRVEVIDRIERGPLPCADDIGMCSYTGDASCLQRVTWEAEIR